MFRYGQTANLFKKYPQCSTDATRAETVQRCYWLRHLLVCHWLKDLANQRHRQHPLVGKCSDPTLTATVARAGGVAEGG